jgi:beta-galactosidase
MGTSSKTKDRLHAFWRVDYEPGTLSAVSYKDGNEYMRRTVKTAGEPYGLVLTADRDVLNADGSDLSFVTVQVIDREGNPVPYADNMITFALEGPATIAAVDNGSQVSHESFRSSYRKAFHGKCLVVIRAGTDPGNVTLKARSESFAEDVTLSLETRLVQ